MDGISVEKATATALAEAVSVLRGVVKTGVEQSPTAAVTLVCDYFDECGLADDAEMIGLIDRWRKEHAGS